MPVVPTITISRSEAELFLRTLNGVADFAETYPLEFLAFCEPIAFEKVLQYLATAERDLGVQLERGAVSTRIDSRALLALIDIEECLAGAKTARVDNSRAALFTAVGGGITAWVFGLGFLSTIGSVAAVSILLLGPNLRAEGAPKEVTTPDLSGSSRPLGNGVGGRYTI